jgi:predicted DsbA family dithiol-disulfide isomerase
LESLQQLLDPDAPAVEVHWRSFELRPKGSPPMPPEYRQRIEAMRPQLLAIARERYHREINQGPFGIDSRPALIGAKYAESQEAGLAYHAAVMRAYWQEARNIGDRNVLADIAESVGLERDAYLAALDDPTYDAQVQADIDIAHTYGLSGVPALIFDNRYAVSGAQPADVLRRVINQIVAEKR